MIPEPGPDADVEGSAIERCPHVRDRISAPSRCGADERVVVRLARSGEIDRIDEYGEAAEADFRQRIDQDVGLAQGAIRIVFQSLAADVVGLEADAAARLAFQDATEFGRVSRNEWRRLSRAAVRAGLRCVDVAPRSDHLEGTDDVMDQDFSAGRFARAWSIH